jgi:large subunit ribosomal protein L29
MKIAEIRGQETAALDEEILKLRRETFRLRMQRATGQSVASSRVREIRRTIARIKTVLGERRRTGVVTDGGARA